ncbi:hypothetical protein [Runella sp.]|jgi:hypothetical protein|uniref:hypothetical protein n=1 Tax=Runella sp. TaxID=1960881 RepID=UPI00263139BC|nr:hypothetical protein [Runella sp.]
MLHFSEVVELANHCYYKGFGFSEAISALPGFGKAQTFVAKPVSHIQIHFGEVQLV